MLRIDDIIFKKIQPPYGRLDLSFIFDTETNQNQAL